MAKVCILLPSHWNTMKGGAEFQADCLARYLKLNSSLEVCYLSRNIKVNDQNVEYSIEAISPILLSQKFGLFWDAMALYRALIKLDPDVVIQRGGGAYIGVAAYYCKRRGKSIIWHISSDKSVEILPFSMKVKHIPASIDRLLLRYGVNNVTHIVAQTKGQANRLKLNYNRVANKIIRNFHLLPENSANKAAEFTVIWVANFKRLKQPEIFVQLAKECMQHKSIKFQMIGRTDESKWCTDMLNTINEIENVEYLGELDMEVVNEKIEKAHILVNTSLFEGLPNTFIQAWMREVSVLSLNVDPDDIIQENNIGCFAQNQESLKSYVLAMEGNRKELAETGRRARSYAMNNFSMKNLEILTDFIENIADKE